MKICILIPVYNNENTIKDVVLGAKRYFHDDIIVVNDGSTDKTGEILTELKNANKIELFCFAKNTGKGAALRKGFELAVNLGFSHVITLDADGQHSPEWINLAVKECHKNPEKLLIGARIGESIGEKAPAKNIKARKFGNLWIKIYTGFALSDTQSGFRIYPVKKMTSLHLSCPRFEFEQEVLLKSAAAGIELSEFAIPQFYQPKDERVSHYRVVRDSFRIGWFFTKAGFAKANEVFAGELKSNISPNKAAISFSLGISIGLLPIYGIQMGVAILIATFLKLNRVLAAMGTLISIPPMIPLIVFAAIWLGSLVFPAESYSPNAQMLAQLFIENQAEFFIVSGKYFVVGSLILSAIAGTLSYLVMYPICRFLRRKG